MAVIKNVAQYVFVLAVLFGTGYVLWNEAVPYFTPPCTTPIQYSIGSIDPQYGISKSSFTAAVKKAAAVWNATLPKPIFVFAETGGVSINLVYTKEQQATTLGKVISAEQSTYDDAKSKLDALKAQYDAMKLSYDPQANAFTQRVQAYQSEVASWNAKGGAPPEIYTQLQAEQRALKGEEQSLNERVASINSLSTQINNAVALLNAAAKQINVSVNTYNKTAGTDFEQGQYKQGAQGASITINEYKNNSDLTRVLTHEFGHALGLGHVENPASIMYSYNIGSGLTLSAEDIAELKSVCKLD